MPRGGKREGAGRKPGAVTKKQRAIAEKATAEGLTPLEVILNNMRFYADGAEAAMRRVLDGASPQEVAQAHPEVRVGDGETPLTQVDAFKVVLGLRKLAGEAARDAAPYMHARISPTEGRKPNDDEVPLAERLKAYAAQGASAGNVVALRRK
jgi:hypothetical protein